MSAWVRESDLAVSHGAVLALLVAAPVLVGLVVAHLGLVLAGVVVHLLRAVGEAAVYVLCAVLVGLQVPAASGDVVEAPVL